MATNLPTTQQTLCESTVIEHGARAALWPVECARSFHSVRASHSHSRDPRLPAPGCALAAWPWPWAKPALRLCGRACRDEDRQELTADAVTAV